MRCVEASFDVTASSSSPALVALFVNAIALPPAVPVLPGSILQLRWRKLSLTLPQVLLLRQSRKLTTSKSIWIRPLHSISCSRNPCMGTIPLSRWCARHSQVRIAALAVEADIFSCQCGCLCDAFSLRCLWNVYRSAIKRATACRYVVTFNYFEMQTPLLVASVRLLFRSVTDSPLILFVGGLSSFWFPSSSRSREARPWSASSPCHTISIS